MQRLILPLVLTAISIGLFLVYTNPTYTNIGTLRTRIAEYDQALYNSQELLHVRDQLTSQYNGISADDRARLSKIMPDNVDNIRLIIDIQRIASQYGMLPRDISFEPIKKDSTERTQALVSGQLPDSKKNYGSFDLSFSVSGTYQNFLLFLNDLEQSLRVVDIESVSFSADSVSNPNTFKYVIKIRTYWLMN